MRKPRNLKRGAKYHVIARINRGEFILEKKWIKDEMMYILKEKRKKYAYHVHQFCIMDNHLHLIIEPLKKSALSRIMQSILCTFAIRFNRNHQLKGHVWYDRYKSIIIHDIFQFLHTFYYISRNPVKAGMVENPEHYPYGGSYDIQYNDNPVIDTIQYYLEALFSVPPVIKSQGRRLNLGGEF